MYQRFLQFLREAFAELKLVNWLSRKEVAASTVVVLMLSLVVALCVGFIDFLLLSVASMLFRVG